MYLHVMHKIYIFAVDFHFQQFIKSVCKLDTSKTLLWAGHVTSDGVYSEGDVAALLSPGEKGPLTLLPGVTEARPGPGAAEVADPLADSPAPGVDPPPSLRYSATCLF